MMTNLPAPANATARVAEKRPGFEPLPVALLEVGGVARGSPPASVPALRTLGAKHGLAPDAFAEVDDVMLMHLASIEGKWLAIHLCGLVGLSVAGAIAAHVFASVYVACFLVGVTAAAGSFATRALITQDRKAAGLSPALCRELLRATRFSAQSFHHKFDLVLLKIVGAYAARMGQEWKPDDLTPLLRLQFQQIADAHGVAAPNFESD